MFGCAVPPRPGPLPEGEGEQIPRGGWPALQRQVDPYGAGNWIDASAIAIRTNLTIAFLPAETGFFNGIGAGTPIDVRQIKQFSKAAAFGAPALGRVVAEHLWVQRLKGAATVRTSAFGGMHGHFAAIIEDEHGATADFECVVNEGLRVRMARPSTLFALHNAHHDLDVVFTKTVEAERLSG